jgi:hypothetical protein
MVEGMGHRVFSVRRKKRNRTRKQQKQKQKQQKGGSYKNPTIPTRGISLYEPVTADAVVAMGSGTMSLKEYLGQQNKRELEKLQLGTPQ